ncbi:MAG: DinB family protein [Micromonosporaceae bacterium]|nr:DinB family protein [Micromonosporaceae bacterium]
MLITNTCPLAIVRPFPGRCWPIVSHLCYYAGGVTGSQPRGDIRPPRLDADEKTTLTAFLDYLREAVAAKAAGLTDEQARTPGVPSGTSLLWLVKHLTAVELGWFVWGYAGEEMPRPDLDAPVTEPAAQLIAAYKAAVDRSNEVIAGCADLDRTGVRGLRESAPPPSMRWLLVHMIEETARHAGHADILREQIDGSVGR